MPPQRGVLTFQSYLSINLTQNFLLLLKTGRDCRTLIVGQSVCLCVRDTEIQYKALQRGRGLETTLVFVGKV